MTIETRESPRTPPIDRVNGTNGHVILEALVKPKPHNPQATDEYFSAGEGLDHLTMDYNKEISDFPLLSKSPRPLNDHDPIQSFRSGPFAGERNNFN